ncbi:hypothetical protein SHKM778_86530 [Streptomyces sp. KM77-8]|uniref:Uncharacterized protein n=1 Tax=Streptomyces haneummycinicus TaxID=3074435 RepID=A0AAT9HYF9_9ACTN
MIRGTLMWTVGTGEPWGPGSPRRTAEEQESSGEQKERRRAAQDETRGARRSGRRGRRRCRVRRLRAVGGGAAAQDGTGTATTAEGVKTGPLSADEVTGTAGRFLTAWQSGKVSEAAALTDAPEAATALLTAYAKDARVKDVSSPPAPAPAARSPSPSRARCRTRS